MLSRVTRREDHWVKTYEPYSAKLLSAEILSMRLGIVSQTSSFELSDDLLTMTITSKHREPVNTEKKYGLHMIMSLIEFLYEMERNGLVHGDIKPDNIVVGIGGDKLEMIDFSLVVSTSDWETPTQSFKREYASTRTNPIKAAIHALLVTITIIADTEECGQLIEKLASGECNSFGQFISGDVSSVSSDVSSVSSDVSSVSSVSSDVSSVSSDVSSGVSSVSSDVSSGVSSVNIVNGVVPNLSGLSLEFIREIYDQWASCGASETEGLGGRRSLHSLYFYLTLCDKYGRTQADNIYNNRIQEIDREILLDGSWIHFYPVATGKYLTLRFISLYENGVWDDGGCGSGGDAGEEWKDDENIEDSLPPNNKIANIIITLDGGGVGVEKGRRER
jgi:serine/threonine protein kinase